jgi:hypothetical protein
MNRGRPPVHGRRSCGRPFALCLVLATFVVQSSSAVSLLPTYGGREVLLNTGGPQPQEAATADFNCDGRMDVVWLQASFGSPTAYPIRVFLANGAGGFTDGTAQVVTGTVPKVVWPRKMLVEDFNGDGRADVFVADTGRDVSPFPGYQNSLLLSTPDCRMVDGTSGLPQQSDLTHSAAAADIDGDDDLDLFTGNYWGGQQPQIPPQILLNDGSGRFSVSAGALPAPQTTLSQNAYTTAAFADVDGDADPDLILGADERTSSSAVLINDGTGRFTQLPDAIPAKPLGTFTIALDIKALDIDLDGKQDLVIAATKHLPYYQGRWLQVLINNGNGTFRDETAQRMPQVDNINTWFKFIEVLDVDNDGALDIVGKVPYQTNLNGGGDHVFWINSNTGVFSRATLFSPGVGLDGVFAFVDLDANGHRDFLTIGEVQTARIRNTGPVLAPGSPQAVRATRMRSDRVRLTWRYVWGATQYEVWRAPTAGAAGSLLGTTKDLTFDDVPGSTTTMYYTVRAVNSATTSAPSIPAPGAIAIPQAPAFTVQPTSQTSAIAGSLQFRAVATGIPAPAYQWQMALPGGAFLDLAPTGPYSGVTSSTLVVTGAPASIHGASFRSIATNSSGAATSSVASATLTAYAPFSDNTLVPRSTLIKATHVTELRGRINAVRARYQLPAFPYSSPVIVAGSTQVRAADIVEMRTALSQAYAAAGLPAPSFGAAPTVSTPIVAADITQLRTALVVIEPLLSSLFDFIGGMGTATSGVRYQGADFPLGNGAVVNAGSIVAGGVSRTGIFIHPPYTAQLGGETFLQYSVPIPPAAFLQFSVGVADDAVCTDGVTFRVTVNGSELWNNHLTRTGFRDGAVRLDAYGGTTVALRIISNPGPANNPNCDWALWSRLALATLPGQ